MDEGQTAEVPNNQAPGNVLAFAPPVSRHRPPPLTDEEILRFRGLLTRVERLAAFVDRITAADVGCPVAAQLFQE